MNGFVDRYGRHDEVQDYPMDQKISKVVDAHCYESLNLFKARSFTLSF
jgi:hypothetical protein